MAQRELTQSSAAGILSGTRTGRADPERDHLATGKAAMREPLYPSLYQINTRVWLTERSRALGRPATLDDVPDDELDRAAGMGFDWIWLLSVWRTGPAAQRVRERTPGFCFMAEVYWDLEWTMLEQGFDYAYDKRPYDRLREGHARPGREHLLAGLDFQNKLARFLENHDEPRASATFAPGMHEAAAVITFLSPGLRFLHQGQFEGQWRLLECAAAWDGNWTSDCFIAWSWEARDGQRILIAVNYAGNRSQCYVRLPFPELSGHTVRLKDQMGSASYDRDGGDLVSQGLYLDLPPWSYHVFEMSAR